MSDGMTQEEKQRILDEVIALATKPHIRPGDVTLADVIRETGLSSSGAREQLKKAVKANLLATELVYDPASRRQLRVWRPSSKEKETTDER